MECAAVRMDCATVIKKKSPDHIELKPPKFISQITKVSVGPGNKETPPCDGWRSRLMEALPSCTSLQYRELVASQLMM